MATKFIKILMYNLMKNYKVNTHKSPDQEREYFQKPQIPKK